MNILIAEDDTLTRSRIQHFLKKWGHQVIAVPDGRAALDKLEEAAVDMIITDWMMPELDGIGLVRQVRSRSANRPYIYVILLTAKGEKQDVITALFDYGVDDYVVKPFDPEELQARISVGERIVRLERDMRAYSQGLEEIVRRQTRIIRQTQEEAILRLMTAMESRDSETGGHIFRISKLCELMAREAGWPFQEVENIRLASPMHDIGKIGVPDQILQKPGKLTPAEFDVIKTHTTIGGQILKNSDFAMIKAGHDIAMGHHEKWDGSGYPLGLSGERIPKSARLVAVVDVYDALSNDRVYRKALPEDQVLDIMEQGRASHFDPAFFDMFMDLLPRFREITAESQEIDMELFAEQTEGPTINPS